MNSLKISVLVLFLLFLVITTFVELPPLLYKIIYSIMAIYAIFFLFLKRKDLQLDSMFSKDEEETETETE